MLTKKTISASFKANTFDEVLNSIMEASKEYGEASYLSISRSMYEYDRKTGKDIKLDKPIYRASATFGAHSDEDYN